MIQKMTKLLLQFYTANEVEPGSQKWRKRMVHSAQYQSLVLVESTEGRN
jgi:hypothetical protein